MEENGTRLGDHTEDGDRAAEGMRLTLAQDDKVLVEDFFSGWRRRIQANNSSSEELVAVGVGVPGSAAIFVQVIVAGRLLALGTFDTAASAVSALKRVRAALGTGAFDKSFDGCIHEGVVGLPPHLRLLATAVTMKGRLVDYPSSKMESKTENLAVPENLYEPLFDQFNGVCGTFSDDVDLGARCERDCPPNTVSYVARLAECVRSATQSRLHSEISADCATRSGSLRNLVLTFDSENRSVAAAAGAARSTNTNADVELVHSGCSAAAICEGPLDDDRRGDLEDDWFALNLGDATNEVNRPLASGTKDALRFETGNADTPLADLAASCTLFRLLSARIVLVSMCSSESGPALASLIAKGVRNDALKSSRCVCSCS
jgi:hypothetical protein